MLERDYKPPMVPSLAHDLDLSFFDPTFTAEPPDATLPTCVDASWLTLLHTLAAVIGCHSVLRLLVWVLLHRCENLCVFPLHCVHRSMVPDAAPDRGSQRISLRVSQTQQLKRSSLFEGFTYEGTQQTMTAGGSGLRGPGLDGLSESDDES